jgi:hypothetical protein
MLGLAAAFEDFVAAVNALTSSTRLSSACMISTAKMHRRNQSNALASSTPARNVISIALSSLVAPHRCIGMALSPILDTREPLSERPRTAMAGRAADRPAAISDLSRRGCHVPRDRSVLNTAVIDASQR